MQANQFCSRISTGKLIATLEIKFYGLCDQVFFDNFRLHAIDVSKPWVLKGILYRESLFWIKGCQVPYQFFQFLWYGNVRAKVTDNYTTCKRVALTHVTSRRCVRSLCCSRCDFHSLPFFWVQFRRHVFWRANSFVAGEIAILNIL